MSSETAIILVAWVFASGVFLGCMLGCEFAKRFTGARLRTLAAQSDERAAFRKLKAEHKCKLREIGKETGP
jgi:hypothetical protein